MWEIPREHHRILPTPTASLFVVMVKVKETQRQTLELEIAFFTRCSVPHPVFLDASFWHLSCSGFRDKTANVTYMSFGINYKLLGQREDKLC